MDQRDQQEPRQPKVVVVGLAGDFRWGFIWGLIIVFVGVALLLDRMDIVPFGAISRFWPLLLVVFGVMNITSQTSRSFGFVLIAAGALLQLNSLRLIHLTFADLWPLAIIAVGVLLIWGSLENRGVVRKKVKFDWTVPDAAKKFREQMNAANNDPSSFHAIAVFSGCERRYTGQHFQGGRATSIFGGVELDFSEADMDEEAILDISCIFGGVEIRVPETWYVQPRSLPLFGALEDKTRQNKIDDSLGGKRKTLIITGQIVFGGVEIRN
jgi:predicted membrane protein